MENYCIKIKNSNNNNINEKFLALVKELAPHINTNYCSRKTSFKDTITIVILHFYFNII